jgi:hypothetical protein
MLSLPPKPNFSSAGCDCAQCCPSQVLAEIKARADEMQTVVDADMIGQLLTEWATSMWGANPRDWTHEEIEKIWQLAEQRCALFGVSAISAFERFTLDRAAVHGIQAETLPGVWRQLFQIDAGR